MSANSIAISRRLSQAGLEREVADAIAEEVVTHTDENVATKEGLAKVEGEVKVLATLVRIALLMLGGIYLEYFITMIMKG